MFLYILYLHLLFSKKKKIINKFKYKKRKTENSICISQHSVLSYLSSTNYILFSNHKNKYNYLKIVRSVNY